MVGPAADYKQDNQYLRYFTHMACMELCLLLIFDNYVFDLEQVMFLNRNTIIIELYLWALYIANKTI